MKDNKKVSPTVKPAAQAKPAPVQPKAAAPQPKNPVKKGK